MSYASVSDLRGYLPQVPEYGQQLITVTGDPFVLTYEGASTAGLAASATATTVQTALRGITAIGTNVKVTGKPGGPYTASFAGTLATDAALLTATNASVTPATDALLQDCLDRATDIVRSAMRSLLADPTFDYAAWPSASTKVLRSYDTNYLTLPPHQLGTVTLAEYQSGSNPSSYTSLTADQWEQGADGRLYRASGWYGDRLRVTAVWGYGPTPPLAIEQLTLEVAVNIWRSRDKGGFTEMIGTEGGQIRQVAGLNKQQQMILENVRDQLIVIGV